MKQTQTTRGMVLGKFLPPHKGHLYLFEFAKNYVDELAIVVETEDGQPVPGELRYQWIKDMFPQTTVLHLTDSNPQDPSEHPDFWQIWQSSLNRILPFQPDFLFASEEYGWKLSEVMSAQFIPVDPGRNIMPVSGTAVRENPHQHWQFIPRFARPFYAKRVCVFGPESTGKSTLCKNLAKHYQTVYVPEYARTHIEAHLDHAGRQLAYEDMEPIARGQVASQAAIVPNCNRVIFSDTDCLTTKIWSEWLFGKCSDWVSQTAEEQHFDLYLVTDVDVPWIEDAVRYLPTERRSFLDRCIKELDVRERNHVLLSGDWEARLQQAVDSVDRLFQ